MLSALTGDMLLQAIAAGDKAAVCRAPGVGPKLAVRIVTELKDKAGALAMGQGAAAPVSYKDIAVGEEAAPGSVDQDAVSALINLGYPRAQAFAAVMAAKTKANDNLQDIIRAALKELSA